MFKIIKWAYQRGVEDERNRIKQEIATTRQKLAAEYNQYELLGRDESSEVRRKRADKEAEINRRVDSVLENITQPRGYFVENGPSAVDGPPNN